MLTGKVPFTGDAAVEIAMKHLSAIPDPPSKLRPEVSHDLDAVVMRALAKDPDQRYASAEEMDADLARVARGAAVSHETEEAMTQVLAGAGASLGADGDRAERAPATPPPAPPAYRPPSYYEDGRAPPLAAGRSSSACSPSRSPPLGGYLIYKKVTRDDQQEHDRRGDGRRADLATSNAELNLHRARAARSRLVQQPRARRSPRTS